ncbi:MAG: glycosyltransferase family 25 protein [Pseudomonadota bacterium]
MQVHAYVLHLVRASSRRDNAQDLLSTCKTVGGLLGEVWPAVDGAAMSSTDLAATVGADLFEPSYPFPLRTGEIGCFLSHRQIWAEMQMRDADAGLIIEDDADIEPTTFRAALILAQTHIRELGYIQFQTRPGKGASRLIDTSGNARLIVPEKGGLRTTTQMVSREAAARLLTLSDPFDRPVDTFVQSHWHTGLRPAMIYPSGIADIANELDGSTIQSQSSDTPLMEKLTRELSRSRYRSGVARLSRNSTAPLEGGPSHDD